MESRQKKIFKILIFILPGVILLVFGLYFYQKYSGQNLSKISSSQSSNLIDAQPSQFKQAPGFELPDAQGKKHQLENFRGSTIILHFWASWCPPCLDEIPQWVELATAFKGRPLKLIAVSLDQEWRDALKILPSEKLPASVTSLLDSSGKLAEQYGSYQFPETYLVGPDLKIRMKWVGPQNWASPAMRQFIERTIFH